MSNTNYRCVIGDATIRELASSLSTWRAERRDQKGGMGSLIDDEVFESSRKVAKTQRKKVNRD